MRIFLSCGLDPRERPWGDWLAGALRDEHEVTWLRDPAAPEAVLRRAKAAIARADALVALLHRRPDGSVPPGVRDEVVLAVDRGLPVLVVREDGAALDDGLLRGAPTSECRLRDDREACLAEVRAWLREARRGRRP